MYVDVDDVFGVAVAIDVFWCICLDGVVDVDVEYGRAAGHSVDVDTGADVEDDAVGVFADDDVDDLVVFAC